MRLCCDLRKYDHVSAFYHRLSWLPLPCFIQFRSLCLMYQQYHHFKCIPLEPPIVFGRTSYNTRTPAYFANIPKFRLSFPQRFFHFKATQWWNSLPSFVTDCLSKPFHQYVDALGQYCSSLHWFYWFFVLLYCFFCFVVLFLCCCSVLVVCFVICFSLLFLFL